MTALPTFNWDAMSQVAIRLQDVARTVQEKVVRPLQIMMIETRVVEESGPGLCSPCVGHIADCSQNANNSRVTVYDFPRPYTQRPEDNLCGYLGYLD